MNTLPIPQKAVAMPAYAPPDNSNCSIRLDANESFIPLPARLRRRMSTVLRDFQFNRYPDSIGTELCHAFSDLYSVPAANVVAGNGSDELIGVIESCLLQKGDGILTLVPDFSMYNFYAELGEVDVVSMEMGRETTLDDVVVEAKRQGVRMVLFSNPCNPTGRGYPRDEVRRMITALPDVFIVLDEAYMDFWDQSLLGEFQDYDNLIVLRTCSKAIGLAGLRVGFAIAGDRIIEVLRKCKSPYNVGALTQALATTVLRDKEYCANARSVVRKSTQGLQAALRRLEGLYAPDLTVFYDTCANFIFFTCREPLRFFEELTKDGIAIRGYSNGNLRVTAGSAYENERFLEALEHYLNT